MNNLTGQQQKQNKSFLEREQQELVLSRPRMRADPWRTGVSWVGQCRFSQAPGDFTSGSVDTQKRRVQHGHQTQTSAASFPRVLIPKPPVTSPPQRPFLYTVFIEPNVAAASPVRQ